MPPTPVVLTGRGHHRYFRHPGSRVGSAIKGMAGVAILAEKRYVVAPFSVHPDGPIYEWHEFLPLTHTDLVLPPPWLIELLRTLGKIQPASTHAAPRAAHRAVKRARLRPSLPVPPSVDLPGVASKTHVFLLATPGVDGEESEWFRNMVQGPDIALACVRVLGIPVDNIGESFRCILPRHDEQRPSASLHWDPKTGVLKYRDRHKRSGHEWLSLPEVRAALAHGKVVRLRRPSQAAWQLRLLVEAGMLAPADVPAGILPASTPPAIRKVFDGFLLLLGCKWLHTPAVPTVFSWRFAMGWCGVGSMTTVSKAMQWLLAHRFIRQVGEWRRAALFLPVPP